MYQLGLHTRTSYYINLYIYFLIQLCSFCSQYDSSQLNCTFTQPRLLQSRKPGAKHSPKIPSLLHHSVQYFTLRIVIKAASYKISEDDRYLSQIYIQISFITIQHMHVESALLIDFKSSLITRRRARRKAGRPRDSPLTSTCRDNI